MRISGLMIFMALSLLLATTGCVKWYCCGYPNYNYRCVKGADTIYRSVMGSVGDIRQLVLDSLNSYNANGFACTLVDSGNAYFTCVQGRALKKDALATGYVCRDDNSSGCGNAYSWCSGD